MTAPIPSRPNLHVALALALGRPTSWSDAALLADVQARCLPLIETAAQTVVETEPLFDVAGDPA